MVELRMCISCGMNKSKAVFSDRDLALAAINGLNGIYKMRGCETPLVVRFADPKKHQPLEIREATAFGCTGFGPGLHPPAIRPPNVGEGMHASVPPSVWQGNLPSTGIGFGCEVAPTLRPPGELQPQSNFVCQSFLQSRIFIPSHAWFQWDVTPPAGPRCSGPGSTHVHARAQAHTQAGVSSRTPGISNVIPPLIHASTVNCQLPGQQQMLPPVHQSASPLARILPQPQKTLQLIYPSSQQAFSPLQPQLQLMQPSIPI